MKRTMTNRLTQIIIGIMSIIFIINLIISQDFNLLWIVLSGGGYIGKQEKRSLQTKTNDRGKEKSYSRIASGV